MNQRQQHVEQIAPGLEVLAQAVVRTMDGLPRAGLAAEDEQAAEEAAKDPISEHSTNCSPASSPLRDFDARVLAHRPGT